MLGNLSHDEIEELLRDNDLGRIGCSYGTTTYIIPINYVYDGTYVYGHSVEGMKIRFMRHNPEICFEVEDVKTHRDWRTAVCWGRFEELTDTMERYKGMKLFADRLMKLKVSDTAIPPEITPHRFRPNQPGSVTPVIYRIKLKKKTGRFEKS